MVKSITRSDVRVVRIKERSQIGWMDNVKSVFDARGMCVEQERVVLLERNAWREVVNA